MLAQLVPKSPEIVMVVRDSDYIFDFKSESKRTVCIHLTEDDLVMETYTEMDNSVIFYHRAIFEVNEEKDYLDGDQIKSMDEVIQRVKQSIRLALQLYDRYIRFKNCNIKFSMC